MMRKGSRKRIPRLRKWQQSTDFWLAQQESSEAIVNILPNNHHFQLNKGSRELSLTESWQFSMMMRERMSSFPTTSFSELRNSPIATELTWLKEKRPPSKGRDGYSMCAVQEHSPTSLSFIFLQTVP